MYAEKKKIKDVKSGEAFVLRDPADLDSVNESSVWIRGAYDRSSKKYEAIKYFDMCHSTEFSGNKVVYTGFTF